MIVVKKNCSSRRATLVMVVVDDVETVVDERPVSLHTRAVRETGLLR